MGKSRYGRPFAAFGHVFAHCFQSYFDPTEARPTNGYGFIVPNDPPSYGAPKKYVYADHLSTVHMLIYTTSQVLFSHVRA